MGATQSTVATHTLSTPRGPLTGIQQSDSQTNKPILHRYTRIPYALPPLDRLRFRRPQPLPSSWSFSHRSPLDPSSEVPGDHTIFGPICPQPVYSGMSAARRTPPDAAPEIENTQDEDCLYLNIWVPSNESAKPEGGWPVQFHIHGGWLQIGDANQSNEADPFDLLRVEGSSKRIIVAATYRLNVFGFLAGKDLASCMAEEEEGDGKVGNFGLWDQRAALEWVWENIGMFGGNRELISVGGLSAGAHSSFLQLYYDSHLSERRRIIKQVYLWSNAIAIQPNKGEGEILTGQWEELCGVLGIAKERSLSAKEKLDALRKVDAQEIVDAIPLLKMHTFRTCTDGEFVPEGFLRSIHDGSFARLLAKNKVRVVLGEVCDEALLYKLVNPPTTHEGLVTQLGNYYPKAVVEKLLTLTDVYDIPDQAKDDASGKDFRERYMDVFARMVADMQVHASERGLTKCLLEPPGEGEVPEVLRYRISWRAKGLDDYLEPDVGVCHAADTPIWWMSGFRSGYEEQDKNAALEFLKPFGDFLEGKAVTTCSGQKPRRISRYLDQNGQTHEDVEDEHWDTGLKVWNAAAEAQGVA